MTVVQGAVQPVWIDLPDPEEKALTGTEYGPSMRNRPYICSISFQAWSSSGRRADYLSTPASEEHERVGPSPASSGGCFNVLSGPRRAARYPSFEVLRVGSRLPSENRTRVEPRFCGFAPK